MRRNLEARDEQRMRFRGTISRFGTKRGYRGRFLTTLMMTNVKFADSDENATDHIWFTCGKWSDELEIGDVVEFDARVGIYFKGYRREDIDYRLERPTKVTKIVAAAMPEWQTATQLTFIEDMTS